MERQLIADYEQDIEAILAVLGPDTHATALELASLPESIRGFGHVKLKFVGQARARREQLLAALRASAVAQPDTRPSARAA